MSIITEIEKQSLNLPDQETAKLADRFIASLPPDFTDDDEIEEARRRSVKVHLRSSLLPEEGWTRSGRGGGSYDGTPITADDILKQIKGKLE